MATAPLIQYANDIGLMAFTKFYFRTQKIILRNFLKAPARLGGLYAIEALVGDIADITDTGMNPLNRVYNPIGFAYNASGIHLIELGESISSPLH